MPAAPNAWPVNICVPRGPGRRNRWGLSRTGTNELDAVRGGRVEPINPDAPAAHGALQPNQSD